MNEPADVSKTVLIRDEEGRGVYDLKLSEKGVSIRQRVIRFQSPPVPLANFTAAVEELLR